MAEDLAEGAGMSMIVIDPSKVTLRIGGQIVDLNMCWTELRMDCRARQRVARKRRQRLKKRRGW